MLIQERLKSEKFSHSQQGVVDLILKEKLNIKTMTVRQIASKAYTSNATLIRIAQKLGYSGWEEFKEDFLKEQEYLQSHFTDIDPNIPFDQSDTLASLSAKIAELKIEAIRDTCQLLDESQLHKALTILNKARIINVISLNNTRILGELFALKMGRIRRRVYVPDLNGEAKYNYALFEKDSAALVISYTGETDTILRWIREIKDAGIPIVVITSLGENSAAKAGDAVLRICTREKIYSKISWYTTEASIEYLLDVLYSGLFQKNYRRNLEYRIGTARKLEAGRASSSKIMEESEADG